MTAPAAPLWLEKRPSVGPPFSDQEPGYRSVPSAFLARIDVAGQLVFAKLLSDGSVSALAVDADGNAFVSGTIRVAPDFTTPGVFQPEANYAQAFVAKFSPSGDKLFATYFGTQNGVQIRSLTLDAEGRPIFCGSAIGGSAPLTPSSLYQFEGRNSAAFCAQLSADGANLIFSTLLDKPSPTLGHVTIPFSTALDTEGNLVVAGITNEREFGWASAAPPEDRRRSLYRSQSGEPYQSLGGLGLASVASIQRVGNAVFAGTEFNGAWVSRGCFDDDHESHFEISCGFESARLTRCRIGSLLLRRTGVSLNRHEDGIYLNR